MKSRAALPSTHFGGAVRAGVATDYSNAPQLTPAVAGSPAIVEAVGDDTNIDLKLRGKGTGAVVIDSASLVMEGTTADAYEVTFAAEPTADRTITFPDATDTLVGKATSDVLTNKTLTGNINADTKFCSTQTDATSNTTLANITGLTGQALVAGASYLFNILLPGTSTANGGVKYAFKYTTATLTSLEATARIYTATGVAVQHTTTATDQASLAALTAQATIFTQITGRVVVNAAGTVALQFAQNASHSDTSSVYVGASMTFTRIA